jgi:DNA-binding IclR family transcriptional regulator
VYKEEGPQAIKMSSRLGSRRPLYCTALGKAYLSALSIEARRALIGELDFRQFTANTITDAAALEAEVLVTRERGYGIDRVEIEEGVACFGAPVCDHLGFAGRRDQRRRTRESDAAQGRRDRSAGGRDCARDLPAPRLRRLVE